MSRTFFDSFFPESSRLLQESESTRWIYNVTFPTETAELCPESTVESFRNDLLIRNPILCCHAFCGVLVGVSGASLLSSRRHQSHLWNIAFYSFAAMNMAAIPLHCFLSPTHHPKEAPWWWALDTFFTGASSTAICLVTWSTTFTVQDWMLVNSIGLMAVCTFFQSSAYTLPLELWYALPTGLAGQLVLLWLFMSNTIVSRRSLVCLIGVAGTMLGSIVADPWFCARGIRWFDAFTSPTMMFLGCNLAFGVLLWHLLNEPCTFRVRAKEEKKDS